MTRTAHSISTELKPEAAFRFLANVENEVQWRQSIEGSRYVGAGAPALGVDGETDVAMGSKSLTMRWTIVDFAEGHRVEWRLDGDPWHGGGSYTVTPRDRGSEIRAALEVRLNGAARVFEPLLGFQLRRGLREDLRRLERLLPRVG
ncbi:SRPBCC family protein [Ruicaihuangia caeni]|uniref:SRPBCC family protein n=1 Tax=Ruicaihuangia caeni TaxID=3042517 RepID=A0AAW6T4V6_9MICO|nr:SRPBCC family protein [Klugiella sp. YN-L-19]MDI2098474.1 SRPBCC family protein [Klugiella sp. YN-L-19]